MKILKSFSVVFGILIIYLFVNNLVFASVTTNVKKLQYNLSQSEPLYVLVNGDKGPGQAGIDTLRNHDGVVSYYFPGVDSTYFASRLRMPFSAASVCTVKTISFAIVRLYPSDSSPCSLFVWRDTIINDMHQPGQIKFRYRYKFVNWPTQGHYGWFYLGIGSSITFNPGEYFWIGFNNLTPDISVLADGTENPDTTFNEIKEPGQSWAGFNYDLLQQAVVYYTPKDTDFGISEIFNVSKVEKGDTLIEVQAIVRNYGRDSIQPGVPIVLEINGPSFYYIDTTFTTMTIHRNGFEYINFTPGWQIPAVPGDYTVAVWSCLVNDSTPSNDTVQMPVYVYMHGYQESFSEQNFPPAGWLIYNYNNDNSWFRTTSRYYTTPSAAIIYWDESPYAPNNDWLITPRISAQNGDSVIFWYRAGSSSISETLLIRASCSNSLDTSSFAIIDTIVTSSTDWQRRVIILNCPRSESIFIAFHYQCDNNYLIALDDIILPEPLPVTDYFPISIIDPKLPMIVDSSYFPRALFRNNCLGIPFSDLWCFYEVQGNTIYYIDSTRLENMEPGDITTAYFREFIPSAVESVGLKVWCSGVNDENLTNDTIKMSARISPHFKTIPYAKDFNENWGPYGNNPPYDGWRIIQGGLDTVWNTNDWFRDTCTVIDSTVRQVAKIYYSPRESQHHEYLISPRLDCSTPGVYNLSYWHWYKDYTSTVDDSGLVLISNNGGQSWNCLTRYRNVSDSGMKTLNISDSASGHSNVKIAFMYNAYDEWWWCIDDFQVTCYPLPPTLIYPNNEAETSATSIQFIWSCMTGADKYQFEIAYDSMFQFLRVSDSTIDTSYTVALSPTTYYWHVRTGYPYGPWSERRRLTITEVLPPPAGWTKLDSMQLVVGSKNIKDGGTLVFCPLDSNVYAFKGNNTKEFFAYDIADSVWAIRESIGFDTIKTRKVKKGAALCFGDTLIYAVKGNNTYEFWIYVPSTNTWIQKASIPGKGLKGGSAIAYVPQSKAAKFPNGSIVNQNNENGKSLDAGGVIFLLKGGSKEFEFWAYYTVSDTWVRKDSAPPGPYNKRFKDGSSLVYDSDSKIYVLKGGSKINEFYFYDVSGDTWSQDTVSTIPLQRTSNSRKYKIKNGGALTILDSLLYAIKGGGCPELWCCSIMNVGAKWVPVDTIPRLSNNYKKSVPKGGAALTADFDKIYLIKGNNTTEFWSYVPFSSKISNDKTVAITNPSSNINAISVPILITNFNINPNPCKQFTNITYNLSKATPISIKLYDCTGRCITSIENGLVNEGTHRIPLLVDGFSPGVYFIGFDNNQQETITKLIIQ